MKEENRQALIAIIVVLLILFSIAASFYFVFGTIIYGVEAQCQEKCNRFGYSFLDVGFGGFHCECLKPDNTMIIIER